MGRGIFIDLIVCTYNNAALLDRTLEAVARQRVAPGREWSVLVVNNNCTDETTEVVERHMSAGRIRLRTLDEPGQGLMPARVCGVRNTSGEWIAFVDDDCLLAEDWVEQAARFASEHPECGAFGGQIIPQWEAAPTPYVLGHRYAYASKYHGETPHRRPWLAGAGMVVRREALVACGWLDRQFLEDRTGARLVSGGDMEIALRVAARYELWYNPSCKLRHVIPARRMSREYLRRVTRGLGASRHNAEALKWRGSYAGWLLYSAAYSIGFGARGALQLARSVFGSGVDFSMAFSPVAGWWAAMWGMLRMDSARRRELIGCAAARGSKRG
ncbi:MAG: glycosyltransferase family 2 protein [Acidobacteria bacterium]|nr:glycosyltransferase family 2 protein [Acidobacteriota bacterium]